jgi:6,7-dimethyl-8-ribityllumazine synthase
MKVIDGMLSAKGLSIGLVAARFNDLIVSRLVDGAVDCFVRHGGDEAKLTLARVPGSYEIPLICGKLADTKQFNAIIALGAVIRGSTPHFDYVASEVTKGVGAESLRTGVPIIFGVLTCDDLEQALERAGVKSGNKGWEAMLAAIEMADLLPRL